MDSVGVSARVARDGEFRPPGEPILASLQMIGRWREFTNGIHCYSRAYRRGKEISTVANEVPGETLPRWNLERTPPWRG
jgi:hypothetical protein